jgi:hypothetical protein
MRTRKLPVDHVFDILLAAGGPGQLDPMCNACPEESIGRALPRRRRYISWSRTTSTSSSASGTSATNASMDSGDPSCARPSNSSSTVATYGAASRGCGARPAAKTSYCHIVAAEGAFAPHATRSGPCSLPNTSTRRCLATFQSASTSSRFPIGSVLWSFFQCAPRLRRRSRIGIGCAGRSAGGAPG